MSVRKRVWRTPKSNQIREAWVADYTDQTGKQRIKTFALKRRRRGLRGDRPRQCREGGAQPLAHDGCRGRAALAQGRRRSAAWSAPPWNPTGSAWTTTSCRSSAVCGLPT